MKETAAAGSPAEAAALLAFVGAAIPATDAEKAAAVAALKNSDIISAYRANAAYLMTDAEGRQIVAVLKREADGANVWQPEAAASFTIAAIFRSGSSQSRGPGRSRQESRRSSTKGEAGSEGGHEVRRSPARSRAA